MSGIQQMLLGGGGFAQVVQTYTTPGTQTVSIPDGASFVTVECIGAGANGSHTADPTVNGGGAGAYSKRNSYSLSGLTGIYISVPTGQGGDAFAKENSSGGTTICLAAGKSTANSSGALSTSCTGDLKYSGGDGDGSGGTGAIAGGGAGGPNGAGTAASVNTPGVGGGGAAGNGGNGSQDGFVYGGGGGCTNVTDKLGAQGWLRLTFT